MSRGFSIVLTADRSQMSNFLGSPLVGFFSCVPCEYIPKVAYEHLLCPSVETDNHSGEVKVAPLSLRRVEAALLEAYPRQDVCIAHPMHLEKAVGENTKIVGLSEMDPRGIGPVTTSMGSNLTPFNRYWFADLAAKLRVLKRKYGFKVVLGGPASWQFAEKKHREVYGIDHVVDGEIDSAAVDVFQDILDGDADELIRVSTNSVGEVPLIRGPTVMGMIEAMRGCGRGCSFCSPNLRMKRQFPVERLRKEAQVNSLYGFTHIWLHAEDMLLYGCDKGDMIPNESAITELFKGIRSIRGVKRAAVTHWSLAGVVANPHVLSSLAEINKLGPREWTGVQVGLETSSRALVRRYLRCKTDPF